jgi:hypothetical protein
MDCDDIIRKQLLTGKKHHSMSLTYEPKFIKESVIDLSYEKFDMMVKLNLFKIEKDIGFVPGYKQISKVL